MLANWSIVVSSIQMNLHEKWELTNRYEKLREVRLDSIKENKLIFSPKEPHHSIFYHIQSSYSGVSHLTHLDLMNSHLTTLLKLSPTSNLTIQNSDLTAIILGTRDQISNLLLIVEFLPHPSVPPSLPPSSSLSVRERERDISIYKHFPSFLYI